MNFELENILTIAEIPQTDDALELSGKLKKKHYISGLASNLMESESLGEESRNLFFLTASPVTFILRFT